MPYVFTEQGIAMLSALLKSDITIKVSINIMKAFIEMRKFITNNAQVFERLIIDNKELYYIGASLKDLGKKCFAISRIEDDEYIEKISNYS